MSGESEVELLDMAMQAYERAKEGWSAVREHVPMWWDYLPTKTVEVRPIEIPEAPPPSDGPGAELEVPPRGPDDVDQDDVEDDVEDDDGWLPDIEWFLFGAIVDWLLGEPCIEIEIDYHVYSWGYEEEGDDSEDVIELGREIVTFHAPQPWAARVGDPVLHGGGAAPGPGSADVFIGGLPALRVSDSHVCPLADPAPHVGGPFVPTYQGVKINGMPALRVGDAALEGHAGPNPVVVGCPTVLIGPPPPAVVCAAPVMGGPPKPHVPVVPYVDWDRGKIGEVKGTLRVGLSVVGPFTAFEGTLTAAHLYAEQEHTWEYSLGDPDFDGKEEFLRHDAKYEVDYTIGKFDVDAAWYPLANIFWWEPGAPKTEKVTRQTEQRTIIVDEDGNEESDPSGAEPDGAGDEQSVDWTLDPDQEAKTGA